MSYKNLMKSIDIEKFANNKKYMNENEKILS